jgi:UDP-N-acetylmuramate-alanine ligase
LVEETKKFHPNVHYVPRDELIAHLKAKVKPYDAVFTLGAGDIYDIHKDLLA